MAVTYFAVVGLDYPSDEDGRHIRVEAGEEVVELNPASREIEVEAGNIRVVDDTEVPAEPAEETPAPAPEETPQDGEPE